MALRLLYSSGTHWPCRVFRDAEKLRGLQGYMTETSSARTQMDPTGFLGTQDLRHSTMRYLLHTEAVLEATYNPIYKCKTSSENFCLFCSHEEADPEFE